MFACLHSPVPLSSPEGLLALAAEFTPVFEHTASDAVILELEGTERLFGSPEQIASAIQKRAGGLSLHIALASTPDAAVQAALRFSGVIIVPAGEEAQWLGPLEVERLPMSPEMAETLHRWGIRTFAQFAALPEMGVAARFGQEGVHLQRIARGEAPRPLVAWRTGLAFERREELEHPVDLLEPLLFLVNRQLQEICGDLQQASLATNELYTSLRLENGIEDVRVTRLPVPLSTPGPLLKLIHLELDVHPPIAAITALGLRAVPVTPQRLQTGLFLPQAPEPAKLELILKRIAKLVGEEFIGTPEIPDTHRPGAFLLRLRQGFLSGPSPVETLKLSLALRVYRPPLRAEVVMHEGAPAALNATGIRGRVLHTAGPWRTAGDWWRADAWDRDEWDITLGDRSLYRIYFDHTVSQWFVEGRYD